MVKIYVTDYVDTCSVELKLENLIKFENWTDSHLYVLSLGEL